MTNEMPDRIRRLAASLRGPEGLTEPGLRTRFGDTENIEVSPGQVWRARWETTTRLVLVLAVDGRAVRSAPVSIEPPGEDADCLVLAPHMSVFGVETTLWAGLTRSIPIGTLDRLLDEWPEAVVAWCRKIASEVWAQTPDGARTGERPSSIWEAGLTTRSVLSDDLDRLDAAPLVPTGGTESELDLRAILSGVGLAEVQRALGVSQPETMQIMRGKKMLTADQLTILADVASVPVETIAAAVRPLPADLASELEQPRWRHQWQAMADRFDGSEAAARLSAGYGVYAMAARQTGSVVPNWRDRLHRWLAADHPQLTPEREGRVD